MEKRIFICYPNADAEFVEDFRRYFDPVIATVDQLDFTVWQDINLLPGSFWNAEIRKNLQRADIGLLMLTNTFFSRDYIKSQELPVLRGKFVVPVLLAPLAKSTDKLGLDALQYHAYKGRSFIEMNRKAEKTHFVNTLVDRMVQSLKQAS